MDICAHENKQEQHFHVSELKYYKNTAPTHRLHVLTNPAEHTYCTSR